MTSNFVKVVAVAMAISFPLVHSAPKKTASAIAKEEKELNGRMHRLVDDYILSTAMRSQNRTRMAETYGVVWKSEEGDEIGVKIIYSGEDPNADAASALEPALLGIGACQNLDCRDYMCVGWCDISALGRDGAVETLKEVSHIIVGTMAETNAFTGSGSVKTQAIAATQISTLLRKYPGLTGRGVKVGIISDSFNLRAGTLASRGVAVNGTSEEADIKSGDLPGGDRRVKVLNEPDPDFTVPVSDEGRVMAQLIHDLASEAEIVFSSGFLNVGGFFASAIEDLVDYGCDVIIDDLRADGFEPIFQLGPTPKAADKAAKENGVAYFTVARNLASRSWESRGYKDTPCPDNAIFEDYVSCHDFGNGMPFQKITKFNAAPLSFYWDDPWTSVSGHPGPKSDLDVFALDTTTGAIVNSSTVRNAAGDAVEQMFSLPQTFSLVIAKYSGPSPSIIKWIDQGSLSSDPPAESSTLTGIGLAPGVAAVGAASEKQVFGQLELESFSSRGGIPLLFDDEGNRLSRELILRQPRFVAPDGSYNTFFGVLEPFEFSYPQQRAGRVPPRFYGTSCSVVNAAAVGAILIQAMTLVSESRRLTRSQTVKSSKKEKKEDHSIVEDEDDVVNGVVNSVVDGVVDSVVDGVADDIIVDEKEGKRLFSIPFDVYKIMESTAIDMNEPGYDFLSGYGLVNALAAVEMVFDKAEKGTKRAKSGKKGSKKAGGSRECPVENFLDPIGSYFDDSYIANATVDG